MTQVIAFIALAIFAVTMIIVGIISNKSSKTLDGFLLGSRNIGAWMSAFSYGTSYFSAVIFIGYAGKHGWDIGFASIWIGIGNALLGSALAWWLLAKRTRKMTHNLKSRTMPEFFEARYGDTKMKIFSAVIIFIFLVPYASSVYKGLGSLFGSIFPNISDIFFGISPTTISMFFVAVLTSIYLVLGGYVATSMTDFIQGIIMILGVVIMVVALVLNPNVGGLSNAYNVLTETKESLTSVFGGSNWSFLLINILLTSFGTWGLPQMIHKYYAIKEEKDIKKATIIATVFALIIGSGAYFVGSLGRFFVPALPDGTPQGGFDYVVPNMLNSAFGSTFWGNILLSVVLLCVLSASMSTLSAVVLTSSSAISVDLLKVVKPDYDKKKQMILTRSLCFVFIALSFIFATFNFAIIVSIMSFSWGVVSGCFIGPYIWGLYSKKTTRAGAWAGLLSGLTVVTAFVIHGMATTPALENGLYEAFVTVSKNSPLYGVIALAVSVVSVPVVSLFTKKLPDNIVERAFINEKEGPGKTRQTISDKQPSLDLVNITK